MWGLKCPDYKKAVNDDIDLLVSLKVITPAEKTLLAQLVMDYHNSNGSITAARQNMMTVDLRNRLHKGYTDDKLMNKDGDMAHIRTELYNNVGSCPYCGNSMPETLDHFMHKNTWKSLSLCRLNLIPACWCCNQKKGTKDSVKFAHPYYTKFPDGIFLRAKCTITGSGYLFKFDFDPSVVTDNILLGKLKSQWTELDLDERLRPRVTQFICSSIINSTKDKENIRTSLPIILSNNTFTNGRNHWKSAVVRSCIEEIDGPDQDTFIKVITDPANATHDMLV